MRRAIFWDGPLEGKAMILADDKHPYILMPIIDHRPTALFDADLDYPTAEAFKCARYDLTLVRGLPTSSCDIYTFGGMQ